jgi:radical SAM-linked protein
MSEPFAVRLRFARQGRAIWLAHLDLMRTFERSIRRAALPVCWSQGYNPRPQLTFALPMGVGLATEGDLLEVFLTEFVEPAKVRERLNQTLPPGLTIVAADPAAPDAPSLMSQVLAADYRLETPGLAAAWAGMDQNAPILVDKFSKGKTLTLDIRPLLLAVHEIRPDCLELRVRAGSAANLRPDLFLKALERYGGLPALAAADCAITRLGLILAGNVHQ